MFCTRSRRSATGDAGFEWMQRLLRKVDEATHRSFASLCHQVEVNTRMWFYAKHPKWKKDSVPVLDLVLAFVVYAMDGSTVGCHLAITIRPVPTGITGVWTSDMALLQIERRDAGPFDPDRLAGNECQFLRGPYYRPKVPMKLFSEGVHKGRFPCHESVRLS